MTSSNIANYVSSSPPSSSSPSVLTSTASATITSNFSTSATNTVSTSVPAAGNDRGPEHFTPLIITSVSPDPVPVTGTDQKVHLVYELQVLNVAPRPATLVEVDTTADSASGPVLMTLTGDQVTARSLLVADYSLPPVPAKTIPPGRAMLLIMDASFASRAAVPAALSHRISATFGTFDSHQGDFAINNFPAKITQNGGAITVADGMPEVVVSPPLQGDGWVAVNACCELSPHRGAMVPVDGRINGGERYAVDFSKFDLTAQPIADLVKGEQATFKGDPSKNESYFAFGQPVLAVADAEVVTVVNTMPEAPPHTFLKGLSLGDLGGNRVVLKLRDGVYAFYGHLKTGSVTVKPGDRVRPGQVIAQLGNSGNTSEAHLHFGMMAGPLPLTDTNLPWVISTLRYDGDVTPEKLVGTGAGPRIDELPLINGALAFPAVG